LPEADPRGVLITRPEPDAQETAARVAALGYRPVLAPAIRIEPRALSLAGIGRLQAVLVTSGNAIPSLPESLHATPLLAVGDATAAKARSSGFWRVSSAGRDAAALARMAQFSCDSGGLPLLVVTGESQGGPLVAALRLRGFRVVRRVAYAARPCGRVADAAWRELAAGRVDTALFFSPASALAFTGAIRRRGVMACARLAPVTAIAISYATAHALSPLPWASIRVASAPNQDELLAWLK
jgi:uroporphyrinogen-III synthase